MGIPVENMKLGMGLVVLRGPMVRTPIGAYGLETEFLEDRTWQGCLLIVHGISVPYVVCRVYHPNSISRAGEKKERGGPFYVVYMRHEAPEPLIASIDSRRYEFSVASKEFMAAFIREETPGPKPGKLTMGEKT